VTTARPPEHLAKRFRLVSEHVMAPDTPYDVRLEMRRFFMVGAQAVYDVLLGGFESAQLHGSSEDPGELTKRLMDEMSDELGRFRDDYERGLV
jgi:hypothetical protein